MGQAKWYLLLLILGISAGAYLVRAQESGNPWPPRPVLPPEPEEQERAQPDPPLLPAPAPTPRSQVVASNKTGGRRDEKNPPAVETPLPSAPPLMMPGDSKVENPPPAAVPTVPAPPPTPTIPPSAEPPPPAPPSVTAPPPPAPPARAPMKEKPAPTMGEISFPELPSGPLPAVEPQNGSLPVPTIQPPKGPIDPPLPTPEAAPPAPNPPKVDPPLPVVPPPPATNKGPGRALEPTREEKTDPAPLRRTSPAPAPLPPAVTLPTTPSPRQPDPVSAAPVVRPEKTRPRKVNPPPEEMPAFRLVRPQPASERPAPPVVQADPPRIPTIIPPTPPAPAARPDRSAITVEKRGPQRAQPGQALNYLLVVRNQGKEPARNLRVEDEIPAGARVIGADAEAVRQGDNVQWTLKELNPGEEQVLRVDLQADSTGELTGTTRVLAGTALTAFRTLIEPGTITPVAAGVSLQVEVKGPATVSPGTQVAFDIVVRNIGNRAATGLILQGKLPPGLVHPQGPSIETDLPLLAPGAEKSIRLTLTAQRAGEQPIEIRVLTPTGQEFPARADVRVGGGASLQVRPAATSRLVIDRPGEIEIQLASAAPLGLRNVEVTEFLPEEVEFAGASDRGLFHQESRTVRWLIDYLPPNQPRTLRMQVRSKTPGTFTHRVEAKAETNEEAQATAAVAVAGNAELTIRIDDRVDPVEVGRDAAYDIAVRNEGSLPATNVRIRVKVPDGLAAGNVQGPTPFRMEGRTVHFEPLGQLAPQEQALIRLSAVAQSPGDQRLRVEVESDQFRRPIFREERTLAYRDR